MSVEYRLSSPVQRYPSAAAVSAQSQAGNPRRLANGGLSLKLRQANEDREP